MTPRPCVFLDRDGTLHADVDFLRDPTELSVYPGAGTALARLRAAGYLLVVVTNQSGVARGYLTEDELAAIHDELRARLAEEGGAIDAIHYSPFHPTEGAEAYRRETDCRKPGPGMLLRAARELDLDLGASWIVGDAERDLEAGRRAGVRGILVGTGKGRAEHERLEAEGRRHVFCPDLSAAADHILAAPRPEPDQGK